jgi:hypothetical protein
MTVNDKVDSLIKMFGLEVAKEYVILWQDEYLDEDDRVFRQQVKINLSKR